MKENIFHAILEEVCDEQNICVKKLSYDWILQLSKDGKVKHIVGYNFDLNPEASARVACDKYATYEVLKSQGIPAVKHTMIFNPATRSSHIEEDGIWGKMMTEFKKYGRVVVKPNYGCGGHGVYLCQTFSEVENAVHKLFKNHDSLSICPYYDIRTEYRAFYLDGKVYLAYGKEKPFVIGNGVSTVANLVSKLNLPDKRAVQENIMSLDLDYVPSAGEKVNISWKHNLSGGAKPSILKEEKLKNAIEALACKAGQAMNIRFATIDIIQTINDELYVLEVNSGIGTTIFVQSVEGGYDVIKEIFSEAVKKMFE